MVKEKSSDPDPTGARVGSSVGGLVGSFVGHGFGLCLGCFGIGL